MHGLTFFHPPYGPLKSRTPTLIMGFILSSNIFTMLISAAQPFLPRLPLPSIMIVRSMGELHFNTSRATPLLRCLRYETHDLLLQSLNMRRSSDSA